MNCEPIICNANDLFSVLADLRKRGFDPWSVDAKVKTNAGYKVSFFERAEELAPPVAVRQGVDGTYCQQVNNPAALTNSKRVVPAIAETAENPACQSNVLVAPTGPRHSPYQGKAPASLLAIDAVKCAVAPRTPSNGHKIPCHGPATAMESCPAIGAETVGMVSIESRLAALQSKLAAEGKLKRSKPSIKANYARIPHND